MPADTTPAHHTEDGRFTNPWPTWQERSLLEVLKWRWNAPKRPALGWLMSNPSVTSEDLKQAFPVRPVDTQSFAQPTAPGVRAAWIGHATCLLQMAGVTFLTDPVFSDRASPFQRLGPRRVVEPAIRPSDPGFPKIDFVLISHNHYDHLDTASVKELHSRFGHDLAWYVPLKLGAWFTNLGITNVTEMDWWQEVQHSNSQVSVIMTPAQHWSSRSLTDRRHTLWGGYCVKGPQQRVWFAGDTGYCPAFQEIGQRLAPIDLAMIPIGAYEPAWFLRPQHCDPAEAVKIHQEVGAKRSFAIHHATFSLTDEALDEPRELLRKHAAEAHLSPEEFQALQHGACLHIGT
ncbi:hypothetical protein WJX74_006230 [Apatococcus lobatus]|uniref:Metallo-beta-lactamase domain-containing protein n=1 Tax=Apatococcus lobatus TaxID=904363 RepID=A0AAW1SGV9_9CHLO